MPLLRPLAFALATAACLCSLRAQETPPPTPPPATEKPAADSTSAPSDPLKLSVTEHTVTIGGKPVKYKVTAGYLVQKDENEYPAPGGSDDKNKAPDPKIEPLRAKAKIFFIAYTLVGENAATRPITFAFNGGPGAASVWLHLGALGPRRVKLTEEGTGILPPYSLIDNNESWLDGTDLVFIDPVSTGYSRPVAGQTAQSFHGVAEDLHSVADFIRLYTTENDRWLSPKFVVGESYGGMRAAAIAKELQDQFDLDLNGIVIVSGVLNWATLDFRPGNDLAYTVAIPGFAAAAWYHKKLSPELQQAGEAEVRRQAEEFASHDYPLALIQGNRLPEAELKKTAQRMAALTGITAEVIERHHLRISAPFFFDELLKNEDKIIGRFDTRITGFKETPERGGYDPSFTTMRGDFTAAMSAYAQEELKFHSELPYRSLTSVSPWNFNAQNHYVEVTGELREAMIENPRLKVWVISGYYDLAVPYFATDYALRQMDLEPALAKHVHTTAFEGGHMVYQREDGLKQFKAGWVEFMTDALKP